jgi:succinate-semialdehyde dehydrogenase/glutarate-semialdehyde dehydrogenase
MLVMREETFGPVVGVMPYRTVDEAIQLANATPYGLATYVYTDDLGEADEFSSRLESGNVAINNPDAGVINAPYGGFKDSGQGYEHGPEGLEQYLQAKHIRIRYFNRKL